MNMMHLDLELPVEVVHLGTRWVDIYSKPSDAIHVTASKPSSIAQRRPPETGRLSQTNLGVAKHGNNMKQPPETSACLRKCMKLVIDNVMICLTTSQGIC